MKSILITFSALLHYSVALNCFGMNYPVLLGEASYSTSYNSIDVIEDTGVFEVVACGKSNAPSLISGSSAAIMTYLSDDGTQLS